MRFVEIHVRYLSLQFHECELPDIVGEGAHPALRRWRYHMGEVSEKALHMFGIDSSPKQAAFGSFMER